LTVFFFGGAAYEEPFGVGIYYKGFAFDFMRLIIIIF